MENKNIAIYDMPLLEALGCIVKIENRAKAGRTKIFQLCQSTEITRCAPGWIKVLSLHYKILENQDKEALHQIYNFVKERKKKKKKKKQAYSSK